MHANWGNSYKPHNRENNRGFISDTYQKVKLFYSINNTEDTSNSYVHLSDRPKWMSILAASDTQII